MVSMYGHIITSTIFLPLKIAFFALYRVYAQVNFESVFRNQYARKLRVHQQDLSLNKLMEEFQTSSSLIMLCSMKSLVYTGLKHLPGHNALNSLKELVSTYTKYCCF
jgi:hypothetical protein